MSFQTYLEPLVDLYQSHILPRFTTKHKIVGISTAISLSLAYVLHDRLFRPPKHLRHIPYFGYWTLIRSYLAGESQWDFDHRVTLPMIDAQESNGIYLRPTGLGWTVFLTRPDHAKVLFLKTDMFPKAVHSTAQNNSIVGRFVLGPNIAFLNDHLWKSQRKIANPAFHRSMPVQLFGELTLQLFDVMEQTGSRVNVSDLIQRWTLDAIGKAGFGFDFKALAQKDNVWVRKYKTIVEASQQLWYAIFPVFDDRTSIWFWPGRRAVHQDMDEFLSMIDCVIQHKRDQIKRGEFQNAHLQENEKDLLTLMIESEHRGEGAMTDEELRSNMCVFFLAGHDTTSNTVAYAAYHLAMHPEIQQKAREEALTILGNEPVDILPTVDHTKQFVYINQVIKETLRINSPAPRINEREAVEDFLLSGTWIPKGTSVLVDLFSVHHSKKNWKDPEVFDPDRFDEDNENNGPRPGMAWVPFSSGARQCIGMNFSLYEQRVLLAMLLRKYIWTLPEDSIHKHGVISSGINIVGPVHLELEFQKRY